jgi:hypothetical protein
MSRTSFLCITIGLVVFLVPASARSQGNTGSLGGAVRDEQGLPVPGVAITIAAVESVLTRNIAAGPDGGFEFPGLLPGEYLVTTDLAGFQRREVRVRLEVNQRVRVEIVLHPAGIAQQVEVRETHPLLHTTDAAVGEVIDQQQVAELPLNGRQFLELAMLVPGAHTSHGAQMGNMSPLYWRPGQSSALTISGGRPNANMYLLDGTTNTDPSFNTYVINLSPDTIREFQIQTGTYTAELGGAGTGQVNVVTKSGTRDLHGSVYEYLRNSAFDSPLFTDPVLPHFSQNQYGATLGGPAGHRVFFFGAFEGFRSSQGQSNIMSVPLASRRLGDFSGGAPIYDPLTTQANPAFDPSKPSGPANSPLIRLPFPNNQIPLDRINPVARQVLQRFVPASNLDGSTNNYLDTRAQRLQNDSYNVRLDRSWAGGSSLFGRYSLSNEGGFTPENLPGFGAFHDNRVQNFTLTAVTPISRRFVNEARLGVARMRLHRYGETANGADLVTELGIPGVGYGGSDAFGLPRFDVQGYDPIGDSLLCTPCRYWNTNIQGGERLTWTEGRHSVRFGGDVRRFVWDMLGFFQNRGYFQFTSGLTTRTSLTDGTGDALASFLLGYPALAQRQAGTPSMNMRQTSVDLFVQDDWRVFPSLTINAGVRYEVQTPLTDIHKILTNLDFSSGVPVAFVGGQSGRPKGLVYADANNVAPRVGVAWAPGEHRQVFRAGYGVFYSYPDMNLWCNQVHNVPLVFPEIRSSTTVSPAITGFGFTPPVLGTTLVGFTAIDTHLQIPRIQQASASIERQLGAETMIQIGYLGAWGRHLDRSRLVNNAQPGAGPVQPRRPNQTITFAAGTELPASVPVASLTFPVGPINLLESTGRSQYNSGWVLAKRTFSQGLSFLASYTYADSLTDAPSFRSPANEAEVPQNSFDPAAEWGPSGCDVRHRFISSLIYKVPFSASAPDGAAALARAARGLLGGWQVSLIYQAQSGFPYTISVFGDTANAGSLLNVNPIRANAVPGVSVDLPSDEQNADHWFNTAAFATPAAFTFGTAGRNSLVGPGLSKADVALDREHALARTTVHFRVEVFNLFNTVNYDTPNRFVNTPQFGTITSAATPARQIQFVLRAAF